MNSLAKNATMKMMMKIVAPKNQRDAVQDSLSVTINWNVFQKSGCAIRRVSFRNVINNCFLILNAAILGDCSDESDELDCPEIELPVQSQPQQVAFNVTDWGEKWSVENSSSSLLQICPEGYHLEPEHNTCEDVDE